MESLIQMGGYGAYVWPAYGVSLIVLVVVLLASVAGARSAEAELDVLQRSRRDRRGAAEGETGA